MRILYAYNERTVSLCTKYALGTSVFYPKVTIKLTTKGE